MVQYFINRQKRTMPAARRKELEKAKRILQERRDEERERNGRAGKARPRRSSSR